MYIARSLKSEFYYSIFFQVKVSFCKAKKPFKDIFRIIHIQGIAENQYLLWSKVVQTFSPFLGQRENLKFYVFLFYGIFL